MNINITKLYKKFSVPLSTVFILGILLIFTGQSKANGNVSYEGTIQGLDCMHYKKKCPEQDLDMYIALEKDFVLVIQDGRHFIIPNLDRGIKTRYLTKHVRITGKQKGTSITATILEEKVGNSYRRVWSLDEQRKLEEGN